MVESVDPNLEVKRILEEIRAGRPLPCYLLWGEEEYSVNGAVRRIAEALIPLEDRDLNFCFLEGEGARVGEIIKAVSTVSLIPGKKAVVLTNAELFQSKQNLPDLVDRLREELPVNPLKAARDFIRFVSLSGFSLEDMEGDRWRKIDQGDWQKLISPKAWEERSKWLPQVIGVCLDNRLTPADSRDESQILADILLKGLPEDNHLLITASLVDQRKRLYKVIGEMGRIVHFARPKGQRQLGALTEAFNGVLAEAGKKVAPGFWPILGARVGFDLKEASQAIEKLINYTAGRETITAADVEAVVGDNREETVFDLIEATVKRDAPRALRILDGLLLTTNHLIIVSFLAREIRLLLQAHFLLRREDFLRFRPGTDYPTFQRQFLPGLKEAGNGKVKGGSFASQHPYTIYNALRNASRFEMNDLFVLLEQLAAIDLAIKTTARDPRLLLERFIINICTETAGSRRPA